ncbi:MAG: DUF4340 domain-containing protein [Microcoleaceae cyanobacterium]
MKLQRSTLILMLFALGLGGYVYFFEIRRSDQQTAINQQEAQIFQFPRDDVQKLIITTPNQTVEIERISADETSAPSPWNITQPIQAPANQAAVDALLLQLTADPSLPSDPAPGIRKLKVNPAELQTYGLDQPENSVQIQLKDGSTHQLVFGTSDFSNLSLYAQLNPVESESVESEPIESESQTTASETETPEESDPEDVEILVVPTSVLASAALPLEEWKFIEAETPEPSAPDSSPEPNISETPKPETSESETAQPATPETESEATDTEPNATETPELQLTESEPSVIDTPKPDISDTPMPETAE